MKQKRQVKSVILETIKKQKMLSAGILTAVIGAVVAALIPPLILAKIIDTVTAGNEAAFSVILLYFVLLALTGILEAAREGLLTVFGQKITHALRSSLMDKFVSLTADSVNKQEPGTLVSRFVGDVDTVENLFTSGIISMFADVCKIISILVVIWFQNRGLTLALLVLLPFYSGLPDMSRKICWRRRLKTERLSDGHPVMCRRRFTISAQSIVLQRKHTWKSVTTLISGRVMQRWSAPIFMMRFTPR